MTAIAYRRLSSVLLAAAAALAPLAAQDQRVKLLPVRVLEAERMTVTGRIVPTQRALVGSRVSGHIASWGKSADGTPIDAGSHVQAGQEIFKLDTAPFDAKVAALQAAHGLAQAQLADIKAGTRPERIAVLMAAVDEIDAKLGEIRRDVERYRRLVEEDKTLPARKLEETRELLAVTEAQRSAALARLAEAKAGATATEIAIANARVKEAEAQLAVAQVDLHDTTITAPFAGVVTQRFRSLGDYVNGAPFIEVLELVSDQDLEAEIRLPEADFRDVKPATTSVTLASPLLDADLTLPITRVVSAIDRKEGVFAVRVRIPPERVGHLVPGAFVQGSVARPRQAGAVLVPASAVFGDGKSSWVFAARDGVMKKTAVVIAERLTDGTLVTGTLTGTDQVVVGPADLLTDGAPLPRDPKPN